MTRAFAGAIGTLAVWSTDAQSAIAVPIRIEPPQVVRAVALNAGGNVYACAVRDGKIHVPNDAPLPWTVAQVRFEPIAYTAHDLKANAPLVLRALGELRVRLRPMPAGSDAVRLWFLRNGEKEPDERVLQRGDGWFETPVASGTYAGAFFTESRGTRIRSGIVIAPGQVTEVGELALEPTASVVLRVVDEKSRRPVQGAKVTWAPPAALNSDVARSLFSRVWSSTTNRDGLVTFRSIGPPPVPARWVVEAAGYARAMTQQALIADTERIVLPDTSLRPERLFTVQVLFPRDAGAFEDAALVVSEPDDDESPRFRPLRRQPLRDGDNKVPLSRFGRLRFSIESKSGRKILFHDVEVSPDDEQLVITPVPTEVRGVVRRQGLPVEGVFVTLADRHDAGMIVGKATTDASGRYSFSTFHSGDAILYATEPHGTRDTSASFVSTPVVKRVQLAGESEVRVDFQLPTSGAAVVVVDKDTRAPVRARVQGSLTDTRGKGSSIHLETDDRGEAKIVGAREGKAKVVVRAKGYRARELTIDVGRDLPPTTIELSAGGILTGRVLDPAGVPIAGARVLGGYPAPLAMQGHFETATDASGRFAIEDGPSPGTSFYVVARGFALAIAVLRERADNTIHLPPPNAGAVRLIAGQGPPAKLAMYVVAPRDGALVPAGVFHALATLNGVSPYQLNSTAKDGTLILPEFLSPGRYTLYRVRPTGKPFAEAFDPIGDLSVPAPPGTIVRIPE